MFSHSTLKILIILIAIFGGLLLLAVVSDEYLDTSIGVIFAVPFLSIYIFHNLGIPGLLQNNGACGWGWCAPTLWGWVFLILFWILFLWFIVWGIAKFTKKN
jgi:hypothetical protein